MAGVEPSPGEDTPPVPEVLHSAFHEGPFPRCLVCGADLTDPGTFYQIQKTWRRGEVVFEMAICAECAVDQVREFSRESLEKMQAFFRERYRGDGGLEQCHFCGRGLSPDGEYEIGAFCRGAFLARPPVVVCAECAAAAQEDLSRKTRDAWGRFIEENLPGVPKEMEPDSVPFTF